MTTPTPAAWAMEAAREAHSAARRDYGTGERYFADCIIDANAAALEAAEARGLERAAAICDQRAENAFQGREAAKCAAAIRGEVKL